MAIDLSFALPQVLQFSFQALTAVLLFFGAWIVLLEASRDW